MSKENVDAVRRMLAAWNRGDFEGWAAPAHPEIEWHSVLAETLEGADTVFRGREGLRRYWDDWQAEWDLTVELTEVHDLGDTVLALGQIRTRGTASGVDLESPIGYVIEFKGDLMRRARAYRDHQQAREAAELSG